MGDLLGREKLSLKTDSAVQARGTHLKGLVPSGQDGGRVIDGVQWSYVIFMNFKEIIMGEIIPALTHWIPLELRGLACLDESSTKMGDPLESPRVAPLLIFIFFIFILILFSIIFLEISFFCYE